MLFCFKFSSYVPAKYCLNWFTVGKVITKIKRVNFLLKHSNAHLCTTAKGQVSFFCFYRAICAHIRTMWKIFIIFHATFTGN